MKLFKHIILVFSAILILLPSAVSFSHIFSEHSHKICDNYAEHHYHEKSLDCDLHKFQKNPSLFLDLPNYEIVLNEPEKLSVFDYYQFLNEYEPLHFDLRGPPMLI